jgi:dGTPase
MARGESELKAFLKARVYRHRRVMAIMDQAGEVVAELFSRYAAEPSSLPDYWAAHVSGASEESRARRICDFVAGMTDRFALLEHRRLFDGTPELG